MSDSTHVREHLARALQTDLVGPFAEDEILTLSPHRWYLTGFIAPHNDKAREPDDPTTEDELGAGSDASDEEPAGQEVEAKVKKLFPASLGVSVLLPPDGPHTLHATVQFADYKRVKNDSSEDPPHVWIRKPFECEVDVGLEQIANGVPVPGSDGVIFRGRLEKTPPTPGLPDDTRALSIFLVNERAVPKDRSLFAESFLFQVGFELRYESGFTPRPNHRDETSDDWDERIADLQYRNHVEYAVGHGVSAEAPDPRTVRTVWLPRAEVRLVSNEHHGAELDMEKLARLQNPDETLGKIPAAYEDWLERQNTDETLSPKRREVCAELQKRARRACKRMAAGVRILAENPDALLAFRHANEAMARAARKRNPERYKDSPPGWRLFQLAFLLLNITGIVHEGDPDRDTVELIYFPTGGGKTEAYLGVIAFTLLLRRIRGRERPDGGLGVAVLLRYTLRLLTMDQLARAATLVCALEVIRRRNPDRLGDVRFAVGLWVGKSATANTLADLSQEVARYKNGSRKTSPFPLGACPWCDDPLGPDNLTLLPKKGKPEEILVNCTNYECDFCEGNAGEALPVLFVDEQIYSELPAFLLATVDKFAMTPWRGETGKLFGRVHNRAGRRFFGPMDSKPSATDARLPDGLRPPELIVQDELHLISGPLGTMTGLYESAVEYLCERTEEGRTVRPKIISATATVRRADRQILSLFGRTDTAVFPPPGENAADNFFSRTDEQNPGRLYLGVAASGQAMKRILVRVYTALLSAAAKTYDKNGPPDQTGDGYMTLAGYFNSLRELGGMRCVVEDDVTSLVAKRRLRRPLGVSASDLFASRKNLREPVELTSREDTGRLNKTRERLAEPYANRSERVEVLLASNMISVGIDIDRLGLMVVAGQPKSASEYIQATSRVGRDAKWPGLVVTCLNLHKPRDRSHYERFARFHDSFYRHVEVNSATPFSGPALDRGLAGALVAMIRLANPALTHPREVMNLERHPEAVERALDKLAKRNRIVEGGDGEGLRRRARQLADAWLRIMKKARDQGGDRTYSKFDALKGNRKLLSLKLEAEEGITDDETLFFAPTSMRDVEPSTDIRMKRDRLGR